MSEGSVATKLDGKAIAGRIQDRVAGRVRAFTEAAGRAPGLTVVLVGDDPASAVYVGSKERTAGELGMSSKSIRLSADTPHDEVLATVERLNADDEVDGILVQLPLPDQIDEQVVLETISPAKDVDGFHPESVGRLHSGLPTCAPCTPAGVMEALADADVNLSGAHAVVVGRSNIVGKPMGALLLSANATVTTCHSRTKNLPEVCSQADVLVAAVGRPGFIDGSCIRQGAVVVDVGINRIEHPRDLEIAKKVLGPKRLARFEEKGHALVGDVNHVEARKKAGLLTPVPGGVGPLTIAMLMANTVDAAFRRAGIDEK
ncbi:MAG: bifunctional methylenetetrahydrofolate dehydrogenase/methenyltetrahydrofolate cyclohydrolase FolD [Acidobacteriota bacterium]